MFVISQDIQVVSRVWSDRNRCRIKSMIHAHKSEQQLEAYARTKTPSLWYDSCQRVFVGWYILEEILRIITEYE